MLKKYYFQVENMLEFKKMLKEKFMKENTCTSQNFIFSTERLRSVFFSGIT